MVFCTNCGSEMGDDWKVCPICGSHVFHVKKKQKPKPEKITPSSFVVSRGSTKYPIKTKNVGFKWKRFSPPLHYSFEEPILYLDLSYHGIGVIPDVKGLENFVDLQALDLSHNHFNNIKGLSNLKNLQLLFLNNNYIRKIEGLENLKNLKILAISDNRIKTVENLETLTELNVLYLNNNEISEIKGFENLNNLSFLTLHNNPILELAKDKFKEREIFGGVKKPFFEFEDPQKIVKYCRENFEKERKWLENQKQERIRRESLILKTKKDRIIQYIDKMSSIYNDIPLKKISEECNFEYRELEGLIEIMIRTGEIKAKIGGNSLILKERNDVYPLRTKTNPASSSDTILNPKPLKETLSIKREYEFLGGQVRFKIGLKNNTGALITNLTILFDLPDALKWIMHEPKYERKANTIHLSKLGVNEKKAISLYLEPINCMESPINAFVNYYDAKDKPHAISMEPKLISITCPIFFTQEEANFARVKRLQRSLTFHDRKILPILKPEKASVIFSSVLSVLGSHDIKLVHKEYDEKEQFGEAYYYGTTKVKKNRHVVYVLFDVKSRTLELEVSADDKGQITAFLAEIGSEVRRQLIEQNIISPKDRFYDIKISVLSSECPYCVAEIPSESVQKYLDGTPIKCVYCGCDLIIN